MAEPKQPKRYFLTASREDFQQVKAWKKKWKKHSVVEVVAELVSNQKQGERA